MKDDITLRKPKFDFMETEYGKISYLEWCEREAKRIGNCKVCQNKRNAWLQIDKTIDK